LDDGGVRPAVGRPLQHLLAESGAGEVRVLAAQLDVAQGVDERWLDERAVQGGLAGQRVGWRTGSKEGKAAIIRLVVTSATARLCVVGTRWAAIWMVS
jgi:hypothetical protein